MSEGREFQIVGAATEKLLEPKHVRTRGTDNRLVSDERCFPQMSASKIRSTQSSSSRHVSLWH